MLQLALFGLLGFQLSEGYKIPGQADFVPTLVTQQSDEDAKQYTITQLSWQPRAYLVENFLTGEECDHIIAEGTDGLAAVDVVDQETGGTIQSKVRTSLGSHLLHDHDEIVTRIENRVAQLTMIPKENQEALQLLQYQQGQKYEEHHDYFYDTVNPAEDQGGQRIVTVLMYLTTPEEGGETVFPLAGPQATGDDFSECSKKGLAIKATRGDALMFWNLNPDLTPDPSSLHESCPTTKGIKWSATKWIRKGVHNHSVVNGKLSACINLHPDQSCQYWKSLGECEEKPEFMHRRCAASCDVCDTAALRDAHSPAYNTHIKWQLDQFQYPPGGEVQEQDEAGANKVDENGVGVELLET